MRVALVIANLIVLCSSKALNGESNQDFDVVCPESQDGYSEFVPHPTDCTLYYQCFGLTPILMSCPEGLFFDPSVDVCNWPDQVDCKQQTEAPETTTVEEETTTAEEETTTIEEETTTIEEETTTAEEEKTTAGEETTTFEEETTTVQEETTKAEVETTTIEEKTTTAVEETTTASLCEEGWISNQNDMCYKLISTKKSANDAEAHCKSLSAEASLVSIHDSETNTFLNSLANGKNIWIGGIRVKDDENIWTWTDGSEWDFDNWYGPEPNNAGGNENFVMMNHQDKTTWNDEDEHRKLAFICQQRPAFSCESGWVASQNRKCYKYISSPLPADEANNYCKGLSNEGSLASIHDSDTNSLLNTLSNGSTVWLGGYRVEDGQDLWAWTDGSQWDFDSWNKNEPNDSGRNEDYVAMNWGGHPKTTWNDYPGHRSYPFICQQ